MQFLEDLIKECRKEVDVKIPELGEYYELEWVKQIMGSRILSKKWIENSYNATLNNISSIQRFLSVSTQREVNVTNLSKVTEKIRRML